MRPRLFSLAMLLFGVACVTTPTPQQKRIIVADLSDALTAASELVGPEGQEYVAAVRVVLDAFAQGEEINWASAFASIRALEPFIAAKLEAAGMEANKVAAALALARIPLRHLEEFVAMNGGEGGPAVAAPIGGEIQ